MLVISAHSDTNFRRHALAVRGREYVGHLDNFVGVHAVLRAFFSGRMEPRNARIELTYGEERDCAGAREVAPTLGATDLVAVVDVTGTPTEASFVVEKCRSPRVRKFLERELSAFAFDLYRGCPDPVAQADETDVYRRYTSNVFFLGIPCRGGDYNRRRVRCLEADVEAVSEALIALSHAVSRFRP